MALVQDFYKFKYSKNSYYIDMQVNRDAIIIIEEALNERLSNYVRTRDTECAYMRLKEYFQQTRREQYNQYVHLKLNKCYLKYIKNLYLYFKDRPDYYVLKALYDYIEVFLLQDIENISGFSSLDEDVKIRVLSMV
jgi:hypothetical protein